MINVGVIGCGKIAQVRNLPEYHDHREANIAAVFDLDKTRADEMARKYGAKSYNSYQELLADPSIDAVSVCTANATHCEITVAALEAGKHVLCEKPMATTLEECERMVEAAERTGKFLMVGHNQRLAKAHVVARNLIEAGEIGKILSFRTTFGHGGPETWAIDSKNVWFFDKKLAALGAMADLGIHKTDLIHFLTQERVVEVAAFVGTLDKKDKDGNLIGVDDNAICIYKLSGGAVGTMKASWTFYGPEDNSTVLYGTKGIMHIYDDPRYAIVIERQGGERVLYEVDQIQTNDKQTKSGVIDAWMDALVKNEPPAISGKEALHAMRVVFAALESARDRKNVIIG